MPPKKDKKGKVKKKSPAEEFLERVAKDEKLLAILDVMDD